MTTAERVIRLERIMQLLVKKMYGNKWGRFDGIDRDGVLKFESLSLTEAEVRELNKFITSDLAND